MKSEDFIKILSENTEYETVYESNSVKHMHRQMTGMTYIKM